jgi:amino acid adenylation domain-containing protein
MTKPNLEDVYGLSPMQQGMLFHTLYDPDRDLYFEQCVVTFGGKLDQENFARAWQRVAARHSILRTSFHWEGLEKPVQVVHSEVDVSLRFLDWSDLPAPVQRSRFDAFIQDDRRKSFALASAPLFRVAVVRRGEELYDCLLSFQHLLLDRWSRFLVLKEVFTEYAAGAEGAHLPATRSYGDYIAWLQARDRDATEAFWRRELAGFTTPTPVATSGRSEHTSAIRFENARQCLSAQDTEGLQSFARSNRLTVNTLIAGAWAILVSRYSGEEDVLFGETVAGRPSSLANVESMVGLFINTLPVRVRVPAREHLLPWLRKLQTQLLKIREQEHSSLIDIQGWSDVQRGIPLFQSLVLFENAGTDSDMLEAGGLIEVLGIRSIGGATNYPLTLFATPGRELSLDLQGDGELFEKNALRRMLGHFVTLVRAMVARGAGDEEISALPLMTEDEGRELLLRGDQTRRDFPSRCIHEQIEEQVARTPDGTAVVFGGEAMTYRELNRLANQVARHLRQLGVRPEARVGICLERSIEMVAGLLGVLKAGGAYVPLDPTYPLDRLAFMVEDSHPAVLLTEESVAGKLPPFRGRTVMMDGVRDREAISKHSGENLESGAEPGNLAYLIYTSGSTGRPKGVAIEHRSVSNLLFSMQERLGLVQDDVLLAVTTLSFDIAGLELYLPLATGACVAVCSRENAADGNALRQELRRCGSTIMQATPVTWRLLLDAGWQEEKLRVALCGGEALPGELAERILERAASAWNLYGPTETTIWSTAWRLQSGIRPVRIGTPLANTEIYLLDSSGKPIPTGVAGQIHIGGAGLARGYWNRPDLTEPVFVQRVLIDEPIRLYATGDRARYHDDGTIEYLGRLDDQVKLRGYRIELGEVETVLRDHPGVRDAVAVIREDSPETSRLVAYVSPNVPDSGVTMESMMRGGPPSDTASRDRVSQWQAVWNQTYAQPAGPDPAFDIAGWNSSYTGEPMPAEDMREWVDTTAQRILSLHPKNVLEIGCGTGLLLLRIAPHCTAYAGNDLSATVLRRLEDVVRQSGSTFPPVRLLARSAEDFEEIPAGQTDTVVLNSVIQYFPGVDYLFRVLKRAVERVAAGGSLFIGDVRSLSLLPAFHLSVELAKASDDVSLEELRRRVDRKVAQEEELVVDPGFFLALPRHLPRIEHVEVLPKAGRRDNEMNRYRYDVILRVGPRRDSPIPTDWLDWRQGGLTPDGLRRILEQQQPEVLGIRNVPNGRIARDLQALRWLRSDEPPRTAGGLRAKLERLPESGVVPGELWAWTESLPYEVHLRWSSAIAEGAFDAAFVRGSRPDAAVAPFVFPDEPGAASAWQTHANNPLRGSVVRKLVPSLGGFLRARLPKYMVPSAIVVLDELPLTPNGKVNRRALPRPDRTTAAGEDSPLPPRTPLEMTLAQIWKDVLALDRVGIRDNFFDLGGHSLLATQLVSRISESFNVRLPIRRVFEQPTVEGLSLAIADALAQAEQPQSTLRMLAEIRGLSDEEARIRLARETNPVTGAPDRPNG